MTTPVTLTWTNGGKHILVAGSFSDWRSIPLVQNSEYSHSVTIKVRPGTHVYKFVADGNWFYDINQPHSKDSTGQINNIITVKGARPAEREKIKPLPDRKFIARHGSIEPVISKIVNSLQNVSPIHWEKTDSQDIELIFSDGETIRGDLLVSRYLARLHPQAGLYGEDVIEATEVDAIIEVAGKILAGDEISFMSLIDQLNSHLKLRTFFVGHDITIADIAIWFALLSCSTLWDGIIGTNKKLKYKFLVRWFNFINGISFFFSHKNSISKVSDKKVAGGSFEELPGAIDGKVRVRFPPEPSGYLHVGHAKAAFLNEYYATKYHGELIVRFDDTNPSKEKQEYEEAILQDLERLGIKHTKVTWTSNYFDHILQKAEELIKVGKAFCDDLTDEQISALRDISLGELKPSPNRDNPIEKNLKMWEEMKKATEKGKTYTLRAKIDYKSENGTLRDPVIYRYVDAHHARTGDKFKIYPIYNFSCPIVDSIEGITHALRSNEYHSSEEQYAWFLSNVPGLNNVYIKDFGRMNLTYTLLSKRKLNHFVDEKLVDSWSDPRFPTIQGVLRRGLTVSALKKFILDQGDSKRTINIDIHSLWAINKQLIDKVIPRYFAVRKDSVAILELDGPAAPEHVEVYKHRANFDLGKKPIVRTNKVYIDQEDAQSFTKNEEITLMDWGNIIVTDIVKSGGVVTKLKGKLHLEGSVKTTDKKVQWLPIDKQSPLVDIVLVEYDNLITVPGIAKEEKDWTKFINPVSKYETPAFADPNVRKLKRGDQFQFERIGYFVLDSDPNDKVLHFVQTPDGHVKNVFLSRKVESDRKDNK